MRNFLRPPSPAMVVALLALFVALGGTAFAVAKINGSALVNRSVSNVKIKKGTLTKTEINVKALGTVPKANTANTANSATTADEANFAKNAGQVDGKEADTFQDKCANGAIKAFAIVNGDTDFPSVFTSETGFVPENFSCAASSVVQARRVGVGNYRVLIPTADGAHVAVANSYGPGSFDEYISLNRESGSNEWEVVIHNSGGLPTDHHFTIVAG